eukprot:5644977-Prymnesium_polylepis.1
MSKRPLTSIKERTALLNAARQRGESLTNVLRELKRIVAQSKERGADLEEQSKVLESVRSAPTTRSLATPLTTPLTTMGFR